MKDKKNLVFSSYSDANHYYIYIYVKDHGKFILENKMKEPEMLVRITYWETILEKVSMGMMVATNKEAIYHKPDPLGLRTA